MEFISTRNINNRVSLSTAIRQGLAADGGLFMPESLPQMTWQSLQDLSYPELAEKILQEFFKDDVLASELPAMCKGAFSFPVILSELNENIELLELYHGPTLSFKDFGARFLAECMDKLATHQKTTILTATSGDTGSAVASAFYGKKNINVIILFPKGQISRRQEQQITCWDKNITSLAVNGTFDDCQQLVKRAFAEAKPGQILSSANSINIGRLLPQIVYYAYSSMKFHQKHHQMPGFIVPTGNLGNATAAYLARLMGFPIREITLATNANKTISDYLQTGEYRPRKSVSTLANAMDVGAPSNFERLSYLFNTFDDFKKNVTAYSVSDDEIRHTIRKVYQEHQRIICPHTATACFIRQKLSRDPWIVVATADACKFETIIEPLLNIKIPVTHDLQILLDKPAKVTTIENNINALQRYLNHD